MKIVTIKMVTMHIPTNEVLDYIYNLPELFFFIFYYFKMQAYVKRDTLHSMGFLPICHFELACIFILKASCLKPER